MKSEATTGSSMRAARKWTFRVLVAGLCLVGILVAFAFLRTRDLRDLEFSIHIDEGLVHESTFGESPTFAIWMEDAASGIPQTVFATRRAASGDWEGKEDVPVALPRWFEVRDAEQQASREAGAEAKQAHAVTGATPVPGTFNVRVRVPEESNWVCWIEMNLAGDYNEHYPEFDQVRKTSDEFANGQPPLLYRAEVKATTGNAVTPEIVGMTLRESDGTAVVRPPEGITTAARVFDDVQIRVIRPKPRIIEWQ